MFRILKNLKGNPRICILIEPLWSIPYNLYLPYATVFMYALGIRDAQIGFLLSIGMVFQVAASFAGGVITDKLGRRLTTVIFDITSWSIPCLIWAFTESFAGFAVAAVLNSLWQITNNSWTCLLVEDCEKEKIVDVYAWIQFTGLLAVFFAPLSALLVNSLGVVAAVRRLYLMSFVLMTLKFLILFCFGKETQQGKIRKQETAQISYRKLFSQYGAVICKMIHSRQVMTALAFMALMNISVLITGNFFSLYITRTLEIRESWIAVFPTIRAVIMLVFMLCMQRWVNRLPFRRVMMTGFLFYLASQLVLIFARAESIGTVLVYTCLEAIGYALVMPRKDSLMSLCIDIRERAKMTALLYVGMIGISVPFGWITGWLSSISGELPFVLNMVLFLTGMIIVRINKTLKDYDRKYYRF